MSSTTEHSRVTRLQNVITELRQDLGANQRELSTKNKTIVQMQNAISSMRTQLNNKNKVIDELKISSKLTADTRTDQMYLQIEEYKNQIHSKESEKYQIKSDNHRLQRGYETLKTQFDNLSLKHSQLTQEHTLRLSRLETMYKSKINNIQNMHSNAINAYKDKIELIKQQSFLSGSEETENIKKSLKELKETHETIETDLNSQIEDLKTQMTKRETEKEQLIDELNQLSVKYKEYAQNEMQKLSEKLSRYENGDIEIVLSIDINDDYITTHKPPPQKPAPFAPKNTHSPQISNSSSHSNNGMSLLSPTGSTNGLRLANIKSNPEFWSTDHSNPNDAHHRVHLSHGSMPSIDSNDESNSSGNESPDDDDKESKSDECNHDTTEDCAHDKLGSLSVNNGRSRDRRRRAPNIPIPHIRTSKSVTSLPTATQILSSLAKQKNMNSKPRTPTFYVFRHSKNEDLKDKNEKLNKGYNALKLNLKNGNSHYSNDKYTDSAIGFLKNGVYSMFGTTNPNKNGYAQTPGPKNSRGRYLSSANSVGFPTTAWNGRRSKRTHSNVSSLSQYSELFSDNLSVTSSTGYDGNPLIKRNGTASSVKLSPHDALSTKSLALQRKMIQITNTRLAEDLKNEKKRVMIVQERARSKYKQLQIEFQNEQRKWKLRERQFQTRFEKNVKELKQNEMTVSELRKKFSALRADYNMRINSDMNGQNNAQRRPMSNAQSNTQEMQALIGKIQSLESNNKQLIGECERYRRELRGSKQTILDCTETMKQQQNQIFSLNVNVKDLRKLNGFGGGSSEQLLQKQIRLLKSQRRMLIQELKNLREQNEKLKTMIVNGSSVNAYKK